MTEFEEVFDDVGENIEKTFKNVSKNKKFWLIAGGVALVALGGYYIKSRNSSGTYAIGTGYAGYPVTVGSSEDTTGALGYSDADVNDLLSDISSGYEGIISDMEQSFNNTIKDYDVYIDGLTDNVNTLSNQLMSAQTLAETTEQEYQRQSIIQQMQFNSNLYNALGAGDTATKQSLHEQNVALGTAIGLTFKNGYWYDNNGAVAYSVDIQAKPATTTQTKTASSGTVSYSSNVDYSSAIVDAILSGAGGDTINALGEQRDAKIAGENISSSVANSGYDANVDYSALISQAKSQGASQSVIDMLTEKRQNKINDMYGGIDPATKTTSTSSSGKTSTTSSSGKTSTTSSSGKTVVSSKPVAGGHTYVVYSDGSTAIRGSSK